MRLPLLILCSIVLISAAVYFQFFQGGGEKGIEATVSRVLDGDTIELSNGDIIRLIGVDAPEKTQPYYNEVIEQLKILEGKAVRMEKDKTNKDRYGRYLRYIFLGDSFVNLELIRGGLVYAYIVSPDKRFEKEFLEAESLARSSGSGIWAKSDYSECVGLKSWHYNAKGEDDKNVVDEFFLVENICDSVLTASGWTVRNTFNSFSIPKFSVPAKSSVKISSGEGKNGDEVVFLSSKRPVWNNKGDVLYLRDEVGRIILSKSYKNS